MFHGHSLCRSGWSAVYGFSASKVARAAKLASRRASHVIIDEELPEPQQPTALYAQTVGWLKAQIELLCEQMPNDLNTQRLPSGLNLKELHNMYITDLALEEDMYTGLPRKGYGYPFFVRILHLEYPLVKKAKHNLLSHCDICSAFKDLPSNLPADEYRAKREEYIKHLKLQALLRQLYTNRVEWAKANPRNSMTIVIDFASSQRK